jgi:hypothetical protein
LIDGAPGKVDINIFVGCLGDLECDVIVFAAVVLIFTIGLVDKVTELATATFSVDMNILDVVAGTENLIGCVETAKGIGWDVEVLLLINSVGLLHSI